MRGERRSEVSSLLSLILSERSTLSTYVANPHHASNRLFSGHGEGRMKVVRRNEYVFSNLDHCFDRLCHEIRSARCTSLQVQPLFISPQHVYASCSFNGVIFISRS